MLKNLKNLAPRAVPIERLAEIYTRENYNAKDLTVEEYLAQYLAVYHKMQSLVFESAPPTESPID